MRWWDILTGWLQLSGPGSGFVGGDHPQPPVLGPDSPLPSQSSSATTRRPNIVFILTDDQDLHMQSLDYLPLVKKHLTDEGTLYKTHFCTTALCCPSRVSLWTGKQAHNTNVTDVHPPYGGYPKFVSQGLNDAYVPVWLQAAGYNTYYTGKLFNAHTVENYDSPYPAGWNGSDFLLDPYTYMYLNASFQRNHDPPVSYVGQHSTDVLAAKAYGLLDEALSNSAGGRPFFLGVAPIAPHSNVELRRRQRNPDGSRPQAEFSAPIPAARHAHLFPEARVPRTPHFNPLSASGADWVARLPRQDDDTVAFNDHYYRQRLRALQGVDELVEGLVERLARAGVLDDTYVFYTADNGFHIGQHRLPPGKECGFDEDINVPLVVRGPGVSKGVVVSPGDGIVTTHIDLAPTLLGLAGVSVPLSAADFDGEAIPLRGKELAAAARSTSGSGSGSGSRHEHVTVEFWGVALNEGRIADGESRRVLNNTYKAVRIVGPSYSLYYSVWCSNEHELYDLQTDPYQMHNLLPTGSSGNTSTATPPPPLLLLDTPLPQVVARLDALLLVLKSCQAQTCTRPWRALHPEGDVSSLRDALLPRFDAFYAAQARRVSVRFDRCELGYLVDAEGPQFGRDGLVYRDGAKWHEWV